ncbi:MAG: collagen-binding domain-containing protein [Pseudomonadota bacterium]
MFNVRTGAVCAALAVAAATPIQAATVDPLDLIQSFNGIVLGDMQSSIHVEGTLYVGGNLNGGGGFYANSDDMAEGTIGDVTGSLIVGGDINAPLTTAGRGTIQIGGSLNVANPNPNPNGQPINENLGVDAPGGVLVSDVAAAMTGLSTQLTVFSDTAGAAIDMRDPNIKGLTSGAGGTGTLEDIAILNLSASQAQTFLGNGNLANLNLDPGVTTIVNIAGLTHAITGTFNQDNSTVMFNFYEALDLTISNTFGFSVLAPNADVTLNRGGMDGTLVASTLNQTVELRPFDNMGPNEVVFTGTLPQNDIVAPVPLPAAVWMLMAGVGALAGMRRFGRVAQA